jgi:hypothetical protein
MIKKLDTHCCLARPAAETRRVQMKANKKKLWRKKDKLLPKQPNQMMSYMASRLSIDS